MAGTSTALQLHPNPHATPSSTVAAPSPLQILSPSLRTHYYDVEYGRFISFASCIPQSDVAPPGLRPRLKIRSGAGTWLASSHATLQLFHSGRCARLVLAVSVRDQVLEEHYVTKLHFSWPHMSCVSSHPRGSRVVFASYINSSGQAEKFAIRFSNSSETRSFIELLKGSLKNVRETGTHVRETGTQCSTVQSEYQPMMDFLHSDERNHSDLSMVPSITDGIQNGSSEQTTLPDHYRDYAALPPSFNELLANSCAVKHEPGTSSPLDYMSQIAKYMSSASFHDMLGKVEQVLNDMEGDLSL